NGYGTPTVMGTVHLRTTVYYTSTQGHATPICHIVCEQVVLCLFFCPGPCVCALFFVYLHRFENNITSDYEHFV
ncbi:MAG: hypothetical protein ACFNVH_01615, partial [Segatella maculosa]